MRRKIKGRGLLRIFLGGLCISGMIMSGTHVFGTDSNLRKMKYSSRSPGEATRWQKGLRSALFGILKMEDLVSGQTPVPSDRKIFREEDKGKYLHRELVDYADIYSLTAPRPLMCQNGLQEGPKDFYVPIARKAMEEIKLIYADLEKPENVVLDVHEGGHVIHLPSLLDFFRR